MKYRAVFTDIDGTLLNSSMEVSPLTAEAIRRDTDDGILFALVSARSPSGIRPIMERYRFRGCIVAYSGALILDENGNMLSEQPMTGRTAGRVLDCLDSITEREPGILTVNLFSGDDWRVRDRSDERVQTEERTVWTTARECPSLKPEDGERVHKILVMCIPERMDLVERTMRENFPELYIARSWESLLEIMDGNVNKAGAVETLCRSRGIDLKETAAFGDHMNDLEMLRAAGCGIAMGNAMKEVKEAADMVTDDNNHDGIAKALAIIKSSENMHKD